MYCLVTFDEDSRQTGCDVLCDSQGMPRVNGTVGKNDSAGADVVATVVFVGLQHSLRYLLSTDVVKFSALFHLVTTDEHT